MCKSMMNLRERELINITLKNARRQLIMLSSISSSYGMKHESPKKILKYAKKYLNIVTHRKCLGTLFKALALSNSDISGEISIEIAKCLIYNYDKLSKEPNLIYSKKFRHKLLKENKSSDSSIIYDKRIEDIILCGIKALNTYDNHYLIK